MRLLWLTPEVPELGGGGGAIRTYHQVRGLAERGTDIVVVAPAYGEEAERAAVLADAGVELRLARRPPSQVVEGLRAVSADPGLVTSALRDPWLGWQARAFWTRLCSMTQQAFEGPRFDAAIVEHDFSIAWAEALPRDVPAGVVFHNASWLYYERLRGMPARAEAGRFRRYVARHSARLSHAWAVSEGDRVAIGNVAPGLAVDVVPNGVDARRLAQIEGDGEPGRLLFTGTLDYPPNADAVRWVSRDIFPRVRERHPGARLTVVGRNPPAELASLNADSGVEVTGWVPDVLPYLGAAAVVVAPLRSGSGTKLKVLEALAAGRPLVATHVAAEGIEVADGEHLLVRDHEEAFADAVSDLLVDRGRAQRLAAAGRQAVSRRYDWSTLADAMQSSLMQWLA